MPFCYECGTQVAPDDPFCGNCGIAQKPISANPPLPPILSGGLDQTPAAPDASTHVERIDKSLADTADTAAPEDTWESFNAHASSQAAPANETPSEAAPPPQRLTAPELRETLVGTVDSLIPKEDEAAATAQDAGDEIEPEKSEPSSIEQASPPEASAAAAPAPALSATSDAQQAVAAPEQQAVGINEEEAAPVTDEVSEPVEEQAVVSESPAPQTADPLFESTAPVEVEPSMSAPALETPASEEKSEPPQLNDTLPPESVSRSTGELSGGGALNSTAASGSTAGGSRKTSKQLETGTLLNGRYEIVRRIGGGGMGAVYLAKDRHLGDAPRAVKEMIETHLDDTQHEKAIGDFKRESLLLTSLEHSSIPTIYDYFYDEQAGRFYLVMKYISGGDFASRLRNAPGGRIDEKTATIWAMEVADVLDYLHNRRPRPIIYRDLKPANLMIDGNSGRVMLIDFGIARWVNKQEEKGVTAVGTMGYAPPELFSGKVEPRSDIYSLGATLFHLLTGSDPQDNPLLIFDFTKNPRPRQINPAISVEMERILMRAVEYKPEGRFRSAAEMREALAAHLERLRVGDVSYGMVTAAQGAGETLQVEMVFCGFCGGRIAADDLYCAHCGAKQPLAGISPSAALQAARSTAKLVVAGTTELDASFLLQKDSNLVGRSDPHSNIFPEVDLSRFDPETKVSRRHARIWRKGETFLVEDLGSVNGTVLLGRDNDTVRLAPHQPRVLENGDKLRLGETMLHFLVG
jgi:serine/threonine-protein kinase